MLRVHTAVLGTDAWGVHLAQDLASEERDLALIGQPQSSDDYKNHAELLQKHTSITPPSPSDDILTKFNTLSLYGGRLFDLRDAQKGFYLAVERDGSLTSLHSRQLLVTAPTGTDLVTDRIPFPGADSVPSGLLIDQFELEFEGSTRRWTDRSRGTPELLALESGFETTVDGKTPVDELYVGGLAQSGLPDENDAPSIPLPERDVGSVSEQPPRGFDWQDDSMPDGFVDTKTERLRSLMNQVLVDEPPSNPEPLVQEIEGLAGEIDSYSRFRTEPGLRRLRWKMLTAMNLIRPFLLETGSPVG